MLRPNLWNAIYSTPLVVPPLNLRHVAKLRMTYNSTSPLALCFAVEGNVSTSHDLSCSPCKIPPTLCPVNVVCLQDNSAWALPPQHYKVFVGSNMVSFEVCGVVLWFYIYQVATIEIEILGEICPEGLYGSANQCVTAPALPTHSPTAVTFTPSVPQLFSLTCLLLLAKSSCFQRRMPMLLCVTHWFLGQYQLPFLHLGVMAQFQEAFKRQVMTGL